MSKTTTATGDVGLLRAALAASRRCLAHQGVPPHATIMAHIDFALAVSSGQLPPGYSVRQSLFSGYWRASARVEGQGDVTITVEGREPLLRDQAAARRLCWQHYTEHTHDWQARWHRMHAARAAAPHGAAPQQ